MLIYLYHLLRLCALWTKQVYVLFGLFCYFLFPFFVQGIFYKDYYDNRYVYHSVNVFMFLSLAGIFLPLLRWWLRREYRRDKWQRSCAWVLLQGRDLSHVHRSRNGGRWYFIGYPSVWMLALGLLAKYGGWILLGIFVFTFSLVLPPMDDNRISYESSEDMLPFSVFSVALFTSYILVTLWIVEKEVSRDWFAAKAMGRYMRWQYRKVIFLISNRYSA